MLFNDFLMICYLFVYAIALSNDTSCKITTTKIRLMYALLLVETIPPIPRRGYFLRIHNS